MPDGKPREGVPVNRLGTKTRCDALIQKLKTIEIEPNESFEFLLTAGYKKDEKEEPKDKPELRIANQMAIYIRKINIKLRVFTSHIRAWGTFEETREAINEIKEMIGPDYGRVEIYISTNLGHLSRVWLCWFFLKPHGWKVHFVRANHSFTPKEWVQEAIKFFVYFYHFLLKKW